MFSSIKKTFGTTWKVFTRSHVLESNFEWDKKLSHCSLLSLHMKIYCRAKYSFMYVYGMMCKKYDICISFP